VDATATIELLPTARGGRAEPYRFSEILGWFGCPLFVAGVDHGFDARLEPESLEIDTLRPGASYRMQIGFLDPVSAAREFRPGRAFTLWSGHTISTGVVEEAPFAGVGRDTVLPATPPAPQ
jgi:hypothetical protein